MTTQQISQDAANAVVCQPAYHPPGEPIKSWEVRLKCVPLNRSSVCIKTGSQEDCESFAEKCRLVVRGVLELAAEKGHLRA